MQTQQSKTNANLKIQFSGQRERKVQRERGGGGRGAEGRERGGLRVERDVAVVSGVAVTNI